MHGGAVAALLHARVGGREPALHERRRRQQVAAAAEGGPDARQEVEEVRRQQAGQLHVDAADAAGDGRHEEHDVGQVLGREGQHEDGGVGVWVLLRPRVGEGEYERLQERAAAEDDAAEELPGSALDRLSGDNRVQSSRQNVGSLNHRCRMGLRSFLKDIPSILRPAARLCE
jgi:hypothetical protein